MKNKNLTKNSGHKLSLVPMAHNSNKTKRKFQTSFKFRIANTNLTDNKVIVTTFFEFFLGLALINSMNIDKMFLCTSSLMKYWIFKKSVRELHLHTVLN